MAWTAPKTYVAGAVHTAAELNTYERDNMLALTGGRFALTGQAAGDDMYATSATQWAVGARQMRQTFDGLLFGTHPDADKAASQVYLKSCREMVFNDGTRVANIARLTADLTVSGAGGLDTGAEGASRNYSAWVIRKSSDQTLNLLLHRTKSYDIDQSQTTRNNGSSIRGAAGTTKLGQTFTAGLTGPMPFVHALLQKVGTPTGRVWLELIETAGNTVVATSDKHDASLISTDAGFQWVEFAFRGAAAALVATTGYRLAGAGDYAISGANYINWGNNSAGGYGSGSSQLFDGTTWTNQVGFDQCFRIYVTQNDTALTMPSGYDQYCLIHPGLYNDSGSNLLPTSAQDRNVFTYGVAVSNVTTTVPTLASVEHIFPPVPVRLTTFELRGSSVGNYVVIQPGLRSYGAGFGHFYTVAIADTFVDVAADMPIEFQRFYFFSNAGNCFIYPLSYRW